MKRLHRITDWWKREKSTSRFRNLLLFLVFVAIAALFWVVLALNDSVQSSFEVKLRVDGVPDSVTFITDMPDDIHVTVRDKGTGLIRAAFFRKPVLHLDFKEFASQRHDHAVCVSRAELVSLVRRLFGPSAQISSVSLDSIHIPYTDRPGKRVPIQVIADVTAASGSVIGGRPRLSQGYTLVYGPEKITDTVTRVYTDRIVRRGLSETTTLEVGLRPVAGTRLIPSRIKVTIPVEPLVNKRVMVDVEAVNAPEGNSVLLFPQRVEVSYYVPMSRFNDEQRGIVVQADYAARGRGMSGRIPVKVLRAPSECVNIVAQTDSLEYTVVR